MSNFWYFFQLAQAGLHFLRKPIPRPPSSVAESDGSGHHEIFFPLRPRPICLFLRPQSAVMVLCRHGEEEMCAGL